MQDAIFRLESNTVDVVLKTHPFAEILYWGPHLQHFAAGCPEYCAPGC